MKMTTTKHALAVAFAAVATIFVLAGCGQPEPEKTKGGTYYEGPMKPKSAGGGGG
jgi:hypothetical protein